MAAGFGGLLLAAAGDDFSAGASGLPPDFAGAGSFAAGAGLSVGLLPKLNMPPPPPPLLLACGLSGDFVGGESLGDSLLATGTALGAAGLDAPPNPKNPPEEDDDDDVVGVLALLSALGAGLGAPGLVGEVCVIRNGREANGG